MGVSLGARLGVYVRLERSDCRLADPLLLIAAFKYISILLDDGPAFMINRSTQKHILSYLPQRKGEMHTLYLTVNRRLGGHQSVGVDTP